MEMEKYMEREETVLLLRKCGRYLHSERGKRPAQDRILFRIGRRGIHSQKELQEVLQIRQGSLSEILIKMEKSGLIEKRRSESDGRRVELYLTEKGQCEMEENHEKFMDSERHLLDVLNEDEVDMLGTVLRKLLSAWEEEAHA